MTTPLPILPPPKPIALDALPLRVCAVVHHVEAEDDDMRRLMTRTYTQFKTGL